jgi:hypothetical protein
VSLTPFLVLFGIVLIIVAIPVALSLGPIVVGAILLAIGLRRAHVALSGSPVGPSVS